MKHFKKLAAVLLALTLLLSACSGGDTSWAFKSGDTQISSGLYILYQITAFGEAEEKIAENMQGDYTGMKSSELLKLTVEDKIASDWIKERAAELCAEHVAVQEKFASLGLAIDDASLAYIESGVGSVMASSSEFYKKNGVSEVTLREFYLGYERKEQLFLALYGEGGELEVSNDELNSYLSENFAKANVLLMFKPFSVPEGETKTLDELTADVKTEAEAYLARLKAGEEIEELAYEWELSQADEDKKADVKKPEKGELSVVISEPGRASYGDALTDAALKAGVGGSDMVDDEYFFAVFKKADILEDSEAIETYKPSALREAKYEDYESKLADWAAAAQPETNTATISRYKPEKIKFD